jgi:hypothetical protein
MTIYRITYLDKYEQSHVVDLPAPDVETAINALEEGLQEQIRVQKIDILDGDSDA